MPRKKIIKTIKCIFYFFFCLRISPALLAYWIKILLKDSEASLFKEDIAYWPEMSITEIIHKRPYYKMVLYRRLGNIGSILKRFCGTYPISINNKKNMHLGGGFA